MFKLKEVDQDIVKNAIKKMHKKKSDCSDGLTQEQLILGSTEASTVKSQATFLNDAIKIWNTAPINIKNCKTLAAAKKEIRKFVTTLPI